MIVRPFIATEAGELPLTNNTAIKTNDKLRILIALESSDPVTLKPTLLEIMNPLGKRVVTSKLPEIGDKLLLLDVIVPNSWIGGRYTARVINNAKYTINSCHFFFEPTNALQKMLTKQTLTPNWEIHYRLWVRNPSDKPIGNFSAFIALPLTITPQQIVKDISIEPSNIKISTDVDGNEWIHYKVDKIDPSKALEIKYTAIVESRPLLIPKENHNMHKINPYTTKFLKKFLTAEPHIESNHVDIKKHAKSISSDNPIVFAEKAVKLVNSLIKYKIQPDEYGAKYAIEKGEGDCTEFSALFVALCRAAGIPARTNAGFSFVNNWERHATAEFLVGGKWIPVDVTGQNGDSIIIGHLPNNIILSRGNWMGGTITKELSYRYQVIEPTQKLDVDINWNITFTHNKSKQNPSSTKIKTVKILEPTVVETNKVKIIGEDKIRDSVISLKQQTSKKSPKVLALPKPTSLSKFVKIDAKLPDLVKDGLLNKHNIQLHNNSEVTQRGCFEIRSIDAGVINLLYFQGVKIPPKGNLKIKPKLQLYKEGIHNLYLVFSNRIGRNLANESVQLSVY
ncbi:MAG: hypothetical protein FK733_09525 [Asgard group archaeon]|nr:hypothetical protein [Asgard group archaeon]